MTLDQKLIKLLEQFIPDERNQLHVLAIIQEFIYQEKKKLIEEMRSKLIQNIDQTYRSFEIDSAVGKAINEVIKDMES